MADKDKVRTQADLVNERCYLVPTRRDGASGRAVQALAS